MVDYLGNFGESGIDKRKPFRCPPYEEFVKQQPCCVSPGQKYGVEFHHLIYKSRKGQSSDIFGVPLLPALHHEYHYVLARKKFTAKYKVDWNRVVYDLWTKFFASYNVDIATVFDPETDTREEVIQKVECKMIQLSMPGRYNKEYKKAA